jgi:hypothetical protein
MVDISFKKFLSFVSSDEHMSDEQITEIFGLFKNNAKLDKLKAEREKLKAAKEAKGKELDKALHAWKTDKKVNSGVISDDDLHQSLGAGDRKALYKSDKLGH